MLMINQQRIISHGSENKSEKMALHGADNKTEMAPAMALFYF